MKKIIITGINGQLSQYLAKYLLENEPDIQIIGTIRHKSYDNQEYIFDISKIKFELMDLADCHSIENLIIKYKPEYFVNTAANAFVGESWAVPVQHVELNTLGVLHQLEAIRKHSPRTRYFNMGTSEEFGCRENNGLQNEDTKIDPKSPYGCSKAAARYFISVYRKSYGLYAIQNWTFNFESPLRGPKYVTKKITTGVAKIKHQIENNLPITPIELGNIFSVRSWQYAGDVAVSVWRSLNQEVFNPSLKEIYKTFEGDAEKYQFNWLVNNIKEYVVSVSESFTVKDFVEKSFSSAEIKGFWTFIPNDDKSWEYRLLDKQDVLVKINPNYFRPLDVTFLNGDASMIKKDLNWSPTLNLDEIVDCMVKYDIKQYKP